MGIKPLYIVLLVTGVALLAVGVTLAFTLQAPEQTSESQSDIPRYTADQVIAIVQAKYPACFKMVGEAATPPAISIELAPKRIASRQGRIDLLAEDPPQFSVVWKVTVTCPPMYFLPYPDLGTKNKTLYFYECDSSLRNK